MDPYVGFKVVSQRQSELRSISEREFAVREHLLWHRAWSWLRGLGGLGEPRPYLEGEALGAAITSPVIPGLTAATTRRTES
jgi:hypothetical protein